jgi:hypothetical protein
MTQKIDSVTQILLYCMAMFFIAIFTVLAPGAYKKVSKFIPKFKRLAIGAGPYLAFPWQHFRPHRGCRRAERRPSGS